MNTKAADIPLTAAPPTRGWFSIVGAGAMIAVGYMDPGNWATDLSAGSHYGYRLLWVVAAASLAAMLLQWTASRVGLVTGRDLAQLCRTRFSRRIVYPLWLTAEIAIIACDVAEVVGSAVALQLLFHVSLPVGVCLSALCTFALLALRGLGPRVISWTIAVLILFVGASLAVQIANAKPAWAPLLLGLIPHADVLHDVGMLWLAAGILGATVMPHNLYLHSALVKHLAVESAPNSGATAAGSATVSGQPAVAPRMTEATAHRIARAMRTVNLDTLASLSLAFLINAALLVVAAAVFHAAGETQLDDLAKAHQLLTPLVGNGWAAPLFACALLACGLNSTVTGTLAGQVVMEGFTRLRVSPLQRTLITRGLALGPALAAVAIYGDGGTNRLLVGSQVVLSMQLPLAIVPMMMFAQDARLMDRWRVGGVIRAVCWALAAVIVILNAAIVFDTFFG